MNKETYRKTILIDLDGVLNEYKGKFDPNRIPRIKKGAKEFIQKLSMDVELKIFTGCLSTTAVSNSTAITKIYTKISKILNPGLPGESFILKKTPDSNFLYGFAYNK